LLRKYLRNLTLIAKICTNKLTILNCVTREFCGDIHEKCIRPLSAVTESQLKPRKMVEQNVELSYKNWSDKYSDHVKLKKRLHVQRRENESLIDQIDGPRLKNEKEYQKLLNKQQRTQETIQRTDTEYYNSLIVLERARQDWELNSFQCCDAIENMEDSRYSEICHIIGQYADVMYSIPKKMKSCCRVIDDSIDNLSSAKEIQVVAEKCRGPEYYSEQLLCDYYQENFNFPMSVNRRKQSLNKLVDKYINDYQKEDCHHDGLKRLHEASLSNDLDIQRRISQSTAMLNFFDATKFKLDRTLNTIDGSMSKPSHLFEKNIEENVDKQGIKFSILKIRPSDLGKLKERLDKKKSKRENTSSSKAHRTSSNDSGSKASGSGSSYHKKPSKQHYNRTISAGTTSSVFSAALDESRRKSTPNTKQHNIATIRGALPSLTLYENENNHQRNKPTPTSTVTKTNSSSDNPPSSSNNSDVTSLPNEDPPTYENIDKDTQIPTDVILCQCIALYDYASTRADELTIHERDVILVYEKGEDQWWRGSVLNDTNGKTGLFPANYVKLLNTV